MVKQLKKILPLFTSRYLYSKGLIREFVPPPGRVNKGDFNRLKPFSTEFGYDRGGPVDRYYIEQFLEKNSSDIKGRVLEIGDNDYTLAYSKDAFLHSDILHINDTNPKATFIGDISSAPQIPSDSFDCIILTQTLHLIYDYRNALHTCFRILKPGGTLLLTAPGITPIDHGEWKETWYWSFTAKALERLIADCFESAETQISSFGNVQTATAFLYGMGKEELGKKAYLYNDPHYPVIITVKVQKPV